MDDILSAISAIEKAILDGKRPMLGIGKIVDDAAILNMINYLRNILPEEIKIAMMVTKNRDEILDTAANDANNIVKNATDKACKILDEHELRRQATVEANDIVRKARKYSETVTQGVNSEVYNIIVNVENNLNDMLNRISEAKNSFGGHNNNVND